MEKRFDVTDTGSWPYAEELLDRGDGLFVEEIRRITDAPRLGDFAARWFADQRPDARRLLLAYLRQPLNAFRHEALVKRLFKLAEKAGDDEVMAHFLVALDRTVRRDWARRHQWRSKSLVRLPEAQALARTWEQEGFTTNMQQWRSQFQVSGRRQEDVIRMPGGTALWRPVGRDAKGPYPLYEQERKRYLSDCWLFSLATRRYLRRRAWRYFRKLGKQHPERYVPAVTRALKLYEDQDVASGLALIDNWGLLHILFHHSPVLTAQRKSWTLVEGKSLADLAPAPMYEYLWNVTPKAFFELIREARCRTVRQWAIHVIRRDHAAILASMNMEDLFGLLSSDDAEVVALAVEVLRKATDLAALGVDRLLKLLETPNADTVQLLCELYGERLSAEQVTLETATQLTGKRAIPVARLGFTWLRSKKPDNATECRMLLRLVEAEAEPLRPEIVSWLRGVLSASADFQPEWVLEYLDSRHADVRREGRQWLRDEPRVRQNVAIWQKLLESPYDDVRLLLVGELEERVTANAGKSVEQGQLDAELVRFLWASVLLNVQRGHRVKPLVVGQLVRRVSRRPDEAPALLPILSVALRSLRGPEWRNGLAGVVQVVERHPDLAKLVRQTFPELSIEN